MKRSRGTNFSAFEKELLVELFIKYKDIIECKKADRLKIKEKDDAWKKVQEEFNSNTLVTNRTTKQLRQFYINLKRSAKKARSEGRLEKYKTGGGQCTTKIDESVLSLIEDEIEANAYDCDAEYYGNSEIVIAKEESPCEVVAVVQEHNVIETPLEESTSLAATPDLEIAPLLSSHEIRTPSNKDSAENSSKQPSHLNQASLCHENIAALAESRATFCEQEMKFMEKKYNCELELLKMKMESERLKQIALREKILYYKEKRRCNGNCC